MGFKGESENPELKKENKIKQEEMIRRKEEKRKQLASHKDNGGRTGRSSMSTSFIEEDEDHMGFDSTSLASLKKNARAGNREVHVDKSDAEEEDDGEEDDDSFIEKSGSEDEENDDNNDAEVSNLISSFFFFKIKNK